MMKRLLPLLFLYLACSVNAKAKPADELAKLKAQVMSADYRADLAELARLRDALAARKDDGDLTYLDRYWSGFASWRIAVNGANHAMKPDELLTNLRNAAADFYQSIRLKGDFADAIVAASMINAWQSTLDAPAKDEHLGLAWVFFLRATELEPSNPRVLWAKGGYTQYRLRGGDLKPAIEVYQQMLKEAEKRGVNPASPQPDWGKPEALMSLAFAHSITTPPDLETAMSEANAALKAVPEWSYVRDNLIPQLEQKQHAQTTH